jgi:hypothetical protein
LISLASTASSGDKESDVERSEETRSNTPPTAFTIEKLKLDISNLLSDDDEIDNALNNTLLTKDRSLCSSNELLSIRRERNKLHAKRTRIRKKLMLQEMESVSFLPFLARQSHLLRLIQIIDNLEKSIKELKEKCEANNCLNRGFSNKCVKMEAVTKHSSIDDQRHSHGNSRSSSPANSSSGATSVQSSTSNGSYELGKHFDQQYFRFHPNPNLYQLRAFDNEHMYPFKFAMAPLPPPVIIKQEAQK